MKSRRAVVAFGGNALVCRGEDATQSEQMRRAEVLARVLARIVRRGWRLVLVHGNGPQVGDELIRVEGAIHQAPPMTLDVCVAQTQGSVGFFLEKALRNALRGTGCPEPVTLVTQVVVRRSDAALRRPTKPVGPYYPRWRAVELRRRRKWKMVEEEDRGFRRVVPSPLPVEILGVGSITELLDRGHVVIAAGGGGIPVTRTPRGLAGVEAVIDKDHTASLLARRLGVDLFVILTDVDGVYDNYGTERQRLIHRMKVSEALRNLGRGQYPPGSMGPKVQAAADFARSRRQEVLITSIARLTAGLAGKAGTRVAP